MRDNNLKDIRKKCGLTQQQVADALGIERSTYTYYEIGRTDPSIATLQKILTLYECSFKQIYPYLSEDVSENFSKYEAKSSINLSQLNNDEKELIINYRLLKQEDKQKIYQQTLDMLN